MMEARNEEGTSWVRKHFDVKEVLVKKKKSGISALALSDVCNVPITTGDVTDVCGTAYKHNLQNGTKKLQCHLLTKYRENESIANQITSRNLNFSKLVNDFFS